MNANLPEAVGILGLGTCVPDKVLTNADLEKMVETDNEWIVTRTGIRERRILADEEMPSDIAIRAGKRALEDAGVAPEEINGIVYCTYTSDTAMPQASGVIHAGMGLGNDCISFDLNAACSGFVKGLQVAYSLIASGVRKKILLFGVDCNTRVVDYNDRATCVLFGDGAGAVVVGEVEKGRGVLGNNSGTDGSGRGLIKLGGGAGAYPFSQQHIPREERYIRMNGREVYKFAVKVLVETMEKSLADAQLTAADVDLLVPHQANYRIVESALDRFGFSHDKAVMNMDIYGNTSAASIPLALETARQDGRLKPGCVCGLVAFGAGLTYASTIIRW